MSGNIFFKLLLFYSFHSPYSQSIDIQWDADQPTLNSGECVSINSNKTARFSSCSEQKFMYCQRYRVNPTVSQSMLNSFLKYICLILKLKTAYLWVFFFLPLTNAADILPLWSNIPATHNFLMIYFPFDNISQSIRFLLGFHWQNAVYIIKKLFSRSWFIFECKFFQIFLVIDRVWLILNRFDEGVGHCCVSFLKYYVSSFDKL